MARYLFQHRTTATALLVAALATCTLTACSSSSGPAAAPQTPQASPQEAALRRAAIAEMVKCARRHGIHLPPATEQGVNVSGVKGARNEKAMGECYHKALKKVGGNARVEQAEAAEQQEQAANPPVLGEETPPG